MVRQGRGLPAEREDQLVTRHDEPNEWGFAGDATAPEPPYGPPDPQEAQEEAVEEIAVPADDLTGEFTDALVDTTLREEDLPETEPESPGG